MVPDDEYDYDGPDSRMEILASDTVIYPTASKNSNKLCNEKISSKNVKSFPRFSEASRNQRNRLHHIVYRDTLEAIDNVISNEYALSIDKSTAIFNFCWRIRDIVRSELGCDPSLLHRDNLLQDILTRTGTVSKVCTTLAAEYVRWKCS